MKVLSLWEPWATLMAIGAKRIETRSWYTPYRGWLAIHASKGGLPKRDLEYFLAEPEFAEALGDTPLSPGHIVAVVRVVECLPTYGARNCFDKYPDLTTPKEVGFGDFSPDRYGWVTDDVFRLPEPIPYKGGQGLRYLELEVVAELRRQWKAARA